MSNTSEAIQPEPTTGVLIGLGLSLWLGLAGSRRSRSGASRPGA